MPAKLLHSCLRVTTTSAHFDWPACVRAHTHTVVLGLVANGAPLDQAQELAHEAFARLFEQWAVGRLTELDFPGLAMRQAMFLLAERRRSTRTTQQRAADLDEAVELPMPGASAEETLCAMQALEAANAALAQCSVRERAVLGAVLAAPDVPQRALAEAEGLSLQRFRQVLCEVRAQLRAALGRRR